MRPARVSWLGLAVAVIAALGGGRLAAEDGEDGRQKKPKRVCLDRREISAISGLDDRHAFVKHGVESYSLLTMDKTCRGLDLARTVAFEGSGARVCGDGTSLVSFEYPAVGPMRCRVERIEPVADKSAALELIASRRPPE